MTGRCLQGHSRTTQAPLTVFHYVRLLIWAVTRLQIASVNWLTVNSMCQSFSTNLSPLKCHFASQTSLSRSLQRWLIFSQRLRDSKHAEPKWTQFYYFSSCFTSSLSFSFQTIELSWGFQNNSWIEVTAGSAAMYSERLKRKDCPSYILTFGEKYIVVVYNLKERYHIL